MTKKDAKFFLSSFAKFNIITIVICRISYFLSRCLYIEPPWEVDSEKLLLWLDWNDWNSLTIISIDEIYQLLSCFNRLINFNHNDIITHTIPHARQHLNEIQWHIFASTWHCHIMPFAVFYQTISGEAKLIRNLDPAICRLPTFHLTVSFAPPFHVLPNHFSNFSLFSSCWKLFFILLPLTMAESIFALSWFSSNIWKLCNILSSLYVVDIIRFLGRVVVSLCVPL